MTVVGEAGIGKSRLIDEFCRIAGGEAHVLRGRCLAYGRGITFWPLVEVVGRAAGIDAEDAPGAAREKLRALFPEDSAGTEAADRVAGPSGCPIGQFPVEEVYWGPASSSKSWRARSPWSWWSRTSTGPRAPSST